MHRQVAVATIFVCLVTPLFFSANAQSCPPPNPPPISLLNAEICALATDQASTTTGFASYSWTITHGSIVASDNGGNVTFSSDGSGDVVLSVDVTDANGCVSTNSATVPLHSIDSPAITAPLELCPYGSGDLSVSAPAGGGSWAYISWTVANGYFQSDTYPYQSSYSNAAAPRVFSNDQGAVSIQVTVADSAGCRASATANIGVRSIQPPVITAPAELCPYGSGSVSVAPPIEGGAWQYVSWSVTNGYFPSDTYPYQTSWASGTNVTVQSDGSGPTTVQVVVEDSLGCRSQSSATIGVRSIQPPVITAPAELCPYGSGNLSVAPPIEGGAWQYVSWSVTNGYFPSDTYPYQTSWANGTNVTVQSDGSGPTTVQVIVEDSLGCRSQSSATISVRSIQPPVITAPAELCPYGSGNLSVAPPIEGGAWQYVSWSVTNGYFPSDTYPYQTSWANGTNVTVQSDGSGPTTVQVIVEDSLGCRSQSSATIGVKQIAPPAIQVVSSTCSGVNATASIDGAWAWVSWSISNGYFVVGGSQQTWASGSSVVFVADGSGPVALAATVSDSGNCRATSTATVAIANPVPVISVATVPVPTDTTDTAQIDSSYTSVQWSITNGTILAGANSNSVTFQADGTGPVTLSVTAVGSNGCSGTASAEYTIAGQPVAINAPASFCTTTAAKTATAFSNGNLTNMQWTITNGTIIAGANTQGVSFTAASFADVTLTFSANVDGAPATATKIIPYQPAAIQVAWDYDVACKWRYTNVSVTNAADIASLTIDIQNGTWGQLGPDYAIKLIANSDTAPVTLTLTGTTNDGCPVSYSHTFGLPQKGDLSFSTTSLCAGGTQTATLTNAAAFQSWSWSITGGAFDTPVGPGNEPAAVTYHATGSGPVTLNVFVYNGNDGCGVSTNYTIPVDVPPAPAVSASGPTTFCAGGSVTLTASAASSYLWSNGATTQAITVNTAGSYSVTATDASGCSATSAATSVTVNALPALAISASGPTTFCAGGSVTLTASAASSYLWSNGATTQAITVNTTGSYSVTATDANGCSATSAATSVTVNALPAPTLSASGPTTFCAGGSVTLTASAGASYQWTNGATSQSITVSSSGTYKVYVTDANGCGAFSAPVTVTVNSPTRPTISGNYPQYFCDGGQPIVLTSSPAASYLWSNGATTQSVSFNTAGVYSVTVTTTDANGCSATSQPAPFRINALPDTTITAHGPTTFCAPGSVRLDAPLPPYGDSYTYLWSNGSTQWSITPTQSGSYSVTITNNSGCSATSAPTVVTASDPPKPTITADGPARLCVTSGQAITLRASDGASSYAWYTGEHTQSITVTRGGTYYVIATYPDGCQRTSDGFTVVEDQLLIQPSGSTNFCNGSVTLTALNNGATSFLWSTGATTQSITVSNSGGYSVTATFPDGCSMTSSQTVSSSSDLAVTVDPPRTLGPGGVDVPLIICPGAPMHYTASVTGGRPPYTYQWYQGDLITIPGATGPALDTTMQDTLFTVLITDSAGCAVRSNFTREFDYSVEVASVSSPDTIPFCPDRTARLDATLNNNTYGETAVSYLWSTGETTREISVNQSGSYSVSIMSSLGCTVVSQPFVVSVYTPPSPAITPSGPTTFCAGGSVTLTASPANGYHWSNGATTQAITVSASGSYSVTLSDSHGCSATSAATNVTVNPLPTPTISASGPTAFCAGGNVTLTASSASSYLWSNGATTQAINVTASGNYSVTVTDANGCSATSATRSVTVNPLPSPTISASGATTFCAGGNVTLTASSASSYLWSTGATTQAINITAGGNYSVTVTDANGCSATSAATSVTVNALPAPAISASGPTTFCAGGNVTLTASSASSYLWSTGATTQAITVNASGNYSVTVTDANGCSGSSAATAVTVNPLPTPTISASGPTTFCAGGSVTLTASAASSYLWSNGATTQAITVNAPGSYSVTVTNANSCSATSAATNVTVNPLPTPTISASGPTTFCSGGNVTLTASSASSYLWSNGETTQAITVNASGNYSVTVIDANGCSGSSAATAVTVNNNPAPAITAPSAICAGGSGNASTDAIAGATYVWTITNGTITSGSGTSAITFTSASGPVSLGVTVTSSSCGGSANATVNVNAVPNATITAPAAICSGASASASVAAVAGATYTWTITNGTITGGSGTNAITFTSTSGTVSLSVTVASNGCSATGSKSVTVNPLPNATITAPSGICSGTTGSASVASVTGGSYNWSITGGTITGGSGTNVITFTSTSGPVSLGVTVTSNGCSASGTANVAVNANPAKPSISAGGPTTFCQGGSVTLTAPAASSYLWSNGATSQSIVVSSNGTFTVTVANASNCTSIASDPVSVTVNPATTITQQPASITIAHNTHTTLSVTATGTGTFTYQWYNPPTANNNDTSKKVGTNSPTFTTPNLAKGTYYYYVVVTGSCGTVRSAIATVTSN